MIGTSISHYRILEELGRGGMGVVYKAEDTKLHRTVAIKFLSRSLLSLGADEKERFYREARAASKLEHPSIETVYEIDERDDEVFIVMGYVEGETLHKHVAKSHSGLPFDEVVGLAVQIAEGLREAHEQKIIHRDIKSDNIIVTPRGGVKIMDFGLAKLMGAEGLTKAGSTVGTIGFMSPEQIQHEQVDHRADIWSFGVVLYEMLTKKLPFRGEHEAAIIYSILNESPRTVEEFRPEAPSELKRIVRKALEKHLEARYQSMDEVLRELQAFQSVREGRTIPARSTPTIRQWLKRPAIIVPVFLALLVAAFLVYRVVARNQHVTRALEETLPTIIKLVDNRELADAYALAVDAEKIIGDDPTLLRLMSQCSFHLTVRTMPAGASVSVKPYAASDSAWVQLGTSPLTRYRLARQSFRLKVAKEGFEGVEMILAPSWDGGSLPAEDTLSFTLDSLGSIPRTMVRISGGRTSLNVVGLEQESALVLGEYLLDKYEVTNREFKGFVDAGGYTNQKYWKIPFVRNGRLAKWAEAMSSFRDATGRPGPASWEMGTYPEGQGSYPVSGVSWFEAAAYAEYAGKRLPTIFQWNHAAGTPRSALIVPLCNFGSRGPAPVGSYSGMSSFGTYDMAGNVKEWVWNEAGEGKRYILGGAWSEPRYMFNDADAQAPFERNSTFGFRCVKPLTEDPDPVHARAPIIIPSRNFAKERPVPENIFAVYKSLYAYDRTPLEPVVESRDSSEEYWTRERVSFNAAYGTERVIAFLFLPKHVAPPYQAVVYFPGSNAIHQRSVEALETQRIDPIIKSGRAVIYPIYKSTYERGDGLQTDVPDTTVAYRDHMLMWAKDCSRSIDYLQTRADISRDQLGYLGVSWGAVVGDIVTAVELRFKAVVLSAGGLSLQRSLPEVDQMNFVPRIKAPVLMLNGRYDFFFPVETSQLPMFNLLRMPESQKRKVVFETGHAVPRVESAREILDWLDRYLGPVNR